MQNVSIKKAALINFISRYTFVIMQIILNCILARILTPDEFGIVAVINVFISFFNIIADMGIGPAVIQNKNLTQKDVNNIFVYTMYMSVILAIIFSAFSILLSIVYDNKVYINLGVLLSLTILFNTLNMVPNALILKAKRFKDMAKRTIIVSFFSSIVTIILAYFNWKYYALIANSIINSIMIFFWNYFSVDIELSFKLKRESINKIKEFASFQFAFNIINYFSRNLDNLLIGKFIGSSSLGYYDKAYKLMLYPVQNLTFVITGVLHPILSDFQNDKREILKRYLRIIKLLSLSGIFISIFCFFSAKEIILIMFGSNWVEAIPCLKILSLSIWAQMVTSSTGAIFQSIGKPKLLFLSGMVTTVISVILTVVGIINGTIVSVSVGVAVAYNLHFIITFFILIKKGFEHKYIQFMKGFIPEFLIALMMFIGCRIIFKLVQVNNIFLLIIIKFGISFLIYLFGLKVTNQLIYFKLIKLKRRG